MGIRTREGKVANRWGSLLFAPPCITNVEIKLIVYCENAQISQDEGPTCTRVSAKTSTLLLPEYVSAPHSIVRQRTKKGGSTAKENFVGRSTTGVAEWNVVLVSRRLRNVTVPAFFAFRHMSAAPCFTSSVPVRGRAHLGACVVRDSKRRTKLERHGGMIRPGITVVVV